VLTAYEYDGGIVLVREKERDYVVVMACVLDEKSSTLSCHPF